MDTSYALYKSYFKLAWRQLLKNKGPISLNVLGMGLALGFCITVYMIHAYNVEFDTFYGDTSNIFRIHGMKQNEGKLERHEATPFALEEPLELDLANVEMVSSYFLQKAVVKKENQYFNEYLALASPNFLDLFDIPLKSGSKANLSDPGTIFLPEETAEKYYGEISPIGEDLTVYFSNNKKVNLTVGGVFKKIPLNTSFNFTAFINRDTYLSVSGIDLNDWSSKATAGQYIKLSSADNKEVVEAALSKYIPLQNEGHEEWKLDGFELIPFIDPLITSHMLDGDYINARVDPKATAIFMVMAALILFIGCFNMANTSMALIAKRVKEIGVRKTLGSFNHQIFTQFLFEMLITMSLAFVLALLLTNVIAREVWGLFGVTFLLQDISMVGVGIFVAGFLLIATVITGIFPALYAWKFEPVSILNHKQELKGVGFLHKFLTVAQYSFSITVLVGGYYFTQNVEFLENFDFGYDNQQLISLNVEDASEYKALKQKVDQLTITNYSFGTVDKIGYYPDRTQMEIDTLKTEVSQYQLGAGYLTSMQVSFAQGRDFIEGSSNDLENSVIVNQEFVEKYFPGNDALNQVLKINGQRRTITGISGTLVLDEVYHDNRKEPMVFLMTDEASYNSLVVKVALDDKKEVERQLGEVWAGLIDRPFNYRWQTDVSVGDTINDSATLKTLFQWLAILGCFMSVIGITSLASLNVAKRTKEISIRKVLGATISQLMLSINKPFIRVLGLSLICGLLMGYFVTEAILDSIYKYHLSINVFSGLPLGLFIIAVALIMTSIAILKPATSNPTVGLRTE